MKKYRIVDGWKFTVALTFIALIIVEAIAFAQCVYLDSLI